MTASIRIFVPDDERINYHVILFQENGTRPEVHEADTEEKAEALASRLAQKHNCIYKFMPPFFKADWKHMYDDDGELREINRAEFVALGNGLFQYNLWSDNVRIHAAAGRFEEIDRYLFEMAIFMQQ